MVSQTLRVFEDIIRHLYYILEEVPAMQHTPSDSHDTLPYEVIMHAETVRARCEAAQMIAARRYWQGTKRNGARPIVDPSRRNTDIS